MLKAVCRAYQVFTDKEKVELTRAAEHGITLTICYFTKIKEAKSKNQQCTISASTLHGWKVKYFQ